LILIVYVASVDSSEVGLMRGFSTEQACEAAGVLAQAMVRKGFRFDHVCVPTR
jgi:hypothetical protein